MPDHKFNLVQQALERPSLVWSPLADNKTQAFTRVPVPGDPERPFGAVVIEGEHQFAEKTGYGQEVTRRGYFADALAGQIRDYRISHWWDDDPNATNCMLCGEMNPNHPEFRWEEYGVQCQVIRDYTMDTFPETPPLRDRMFKLVDIDVEQALEQIGYPGRS